MYSTLKAREELIHYLPYLPYVLLEGFMMFHKDLLTAYDSMEGELPHHETSHTPASWK